jgi:hypothetical protein
MSKFDIRLSYKDCCILKHGLKNSLHQKQSLLFMDGLTSFEPDKLSLEKRKKLEKEVQEEKRALERFTEEIKRNKENNHMKAR